MQLGEHVCEGIGRKSIYNWVCFTAYGLPRGIFWDKASNCRGKDSLGNEVHKGGYFEQMVLK